MILKFEIMFLYWKKKFKISLEIQNHVFLKKRIFQNYLEIKNHENLQLIK